MVQLKHKIEEIRNTMPPALRTTTVTRRYGDALS